MAVMFRRRLYPFASTNGASGWMVFESNGKARDAAKALANMGITVAVDSGRECTLIPKA